MSFTYLYRMKSVSKLSVSSSSFLRSFYLFILRSVSKFSVLYGHFFCRFVCLFGPIFSKWNISAIVEKRVTPYTVCPVRWASFFLVNRVEHQKLNQTTPYVRRRLVEFLVFNLAVGRWKWRISAELIIIMTYSLR